MTITSENQKLGTIQGCSTLFPNLTPTDPSGSPICNIRQDGSTVDSMVQRIFMGLPRWRYSQRSSVWKFVATTGSKEIELGSAGFFENPNNFEIRLTPNSDTSTKAILLTTGFLLVSSGIITKFLFSRTTSSVKL